MKTARTITRASNLVLLVTAISTGVSFAQAPDTLWTRTYGGTGWDHGYSVAQTSDGGYIIAGSYEGPESNIDVYLIKTDSQGDTLWTRTYGRAALDEGYGVEQTSDGGYVVVGASGEMGDVDAYLIKTDSNGDTIWTRTYGGSSVDEAFAVQQTSDGGYVMAGFTMSFAVGQEDAWIIKTDQNGDTIWTATYGGGNLDVAPSVQETADGAYVVAGYTWSYGPVGMAFLAKTGANGDSLWMKLYVPTSHQKAYCVRQTADGGYVFVGERRSSATNDDDVWLVRTDANGDTLWTRIYGGDLNQHGKSLEILSDSGYIIAGNFYHLQPGAIDMYVIRTDAHGDTLWTRTYGGSDTELSEDVLETSDGGYVIVGDTQSPPVIGRDIYLVRLGGNGQPSYPNLVGDCESELLSGLADWTNDDSLTMMYDDGTHGDGIPGDRIYSSVVEGAADDFPLSQSAGHQVVGTSGEWSPQFPGQNVPVAFGSGDTVGFYLDRNQYTDGFIPESCVVYNSWMSVSTWPGPHYVVGSCQDEFGASADWSSSDTTMKMNDAGVDGDVAAGDLVYTYRGVCSAAGSYEFKVLNSYDSWQPQYTGEGFVWDWGSNLSFSTATDGNAVTFETDIATGRTRVTVVAEVFIRADSDGDTDVAMSDAIFILKHLYVPGSPSPDCMDSADSDDGGSIEMSDAIYTLKYLYVPGSPAPPPPGPDACGPDPSGDGLDCSSHPCMDGT